MDASLPEQLAVVCALDPDPSFDVADPAGGDQRVYNECAEQLWLMAQAFATVIADET